MAKGPGKGRRLPDAKALRALEAWKACGRSRNRAVALLEMKLSTFEDHLAVAFKRFGRPETAPPRRRAADPWPVDGPDLHTAADGRLVDSAGNPATPPPVEESDRAAQIEREAAQGGWAPAHDLSSPLPDGLVLKGVSTLSDAGGAKQQEWVKSRLAGQDPGEAVRLADPKRIVKVSTLFDQQGRVTQQWVAERPEDAQREALWQEWAQELAAGLPRVVPTEPPAETSEDLLAAYPVGDHHLGMLSWDKETGRNYDLAIGERLLTGAIDYLVERAPDCAQALIPLLGDLMHYDSLEAVTPTSRNLLDADGRYPKMVAVALRSVRYLIASALRRHRRVHVIVEIGNHDLANSIFLALCLANIYELEPRVTIDTSPAHYHYFEWGRCLIGTHHGHGAKLEALPLIMATDRAEAWGRTLHRYWWTGHVHHGQRAVITHQAKDFNGCSVESFRILPPEDAHHAGKGYRALSDMKGIVLHRQWGEVARFTVNPDMLRSAD